MKPILIYDGNCGFCKKWVERWQVLTGDTVDYAPYQEVADHFPKISKDEFAEAVKFVDQDERIYSAAEAVFQLMRHKEAGGEWGLWFYKYFPGFSLASEFVYRNIAGHRDFFMNITRLFWGKDVLRPTYQITQQIFPRVLSLIFLIAILSLWTQIDGLVGSRGILPVQSFLHIVKENFGGSTYLQFPTYFWVSASDTFLHAICAVGTTLALLGIFFPFSVWIWFLLWSIYLSLMIVGQDFLSFQWDILLVETGFLAIFLSPLSIIPKSKNLIVSRIVRWLFVWLLFRLMFASGVVKLASGDLTWHNITALTYHFETQPLATWIGWFVHQLPNWFLVLSTGVMFMVELIIPFFIFSPRRLRLLAFWLLVVFQTLIGLTGNYCFFNLLTIALCLWLIDDRSWHGSIQKVFSKWLLISEKECHSNFHDWPKWIRAALFGVVIFMSGILMISATFGMRVNWPAPVRHIYSLMSPFHVVNSYGLFAVMTTERPEIIVEGSNDGKNWKAYQFKYKPDDLSKRPSFVEPHQPRLDWQMWFAALGDVRRNPWFINFCIRLLEGSGPVLNLLKENPFPHAPPKYIRALLFNYQFTDLGEKAESGHWWKRKFRGQYLQPISQDKIQVI
jgi:predicted DCC family thiol-disulfide oxidoreductase YuxK